MTTSLIKIKLPISSSAAKVEEFLEITNYDMLLDVYTNEGAFGVSDADSGGANGIALIFDFYNGGALLEVNYSSYNNYALNEIRRNSRWQKNSTDTSVTYTLEVEGSISDSDIDFYVERSGLESVFSPDWITVERLSGDKYLNSSGLSRYDKKIKFHILSSLTRKQDKLQNGVNIKSINNQSLLGSGNLTIPTGPSMYIGDNATTIDFEQSDDGWFITKASDGNLKLGISDGTNSNVYILAEKSDLNNKVNTTDYATNSEYGIVKLNSNESITLNADGQLDIGGRLGAFPGTTGIYHSKDREPRQVSDFSLLITDAKGMNLAAPRDLALSTGVNLALKSSHAAGSTTYQVANNYANRIACYALKNGGYAGQNEAWCKENQIVAITSVTINGSTNWTPDSSANDNVNNIVITTETSANPTASVSQLRVFGGITGGYCSEYIGQCVGGTAGASLTIGQRVYSQNNVNCVVSADTWNSGNGNAIFGRQHISRKNRWFIAGTGHDTTNGKSESGAVLGEWASISANTAFAIGNGTSHIDRSNLFEITNDGGIVLNSPNGTRYKISVDNSGNLTTTAA